jgi:hypothetical protein
MKAKVCLATIVLASAMFTSMASGEVALPEEIKKIAPIYKGAKVVQSMQMQGAVQAIFEVQAKPREVITFYKDAMEKKGWKVVMEMDMENTSMMNLAIDNNNLMVNATAKEGEKTVLQLILKTGE